MLAVASALNLLSKDYVTAYDDKDPMRKLADSLFDLSLEIQENILIPYVSIL